ncbi:hypothetical protein GYMLUDRAFT_248025 [Collybiopsis luxurians FD-317 M1]|uniref:Uncharacterized protein n=1 Tax=Collybiopsis luxurians FD-317 M1 TaxID=944289 RepID=A0A0D0CM63_9AGAR|nr:hypothetical protein GYMLUDRAFT_248025 [Collybiopsis luxurians FD-317 M1]
MNVQDQPPHFHNVERQYEDGKSYEKTYWFLKNRASGVPVAELAFRCFGVNQSLGLCKAEMPWVVNPKYLKYHPVATLPMEAALAAHFCLAASIKFHSTAKRIPYHEVHLVIEFNNEILQNILEEVLGFLANLRVSDSGLKAVPERPDTDLNAKAEELIDKLKEIVNVKCDLPIDEKAIEMLFPDID